MPPFVPSVFTLTDRTKKLLWWSLGFMFIARMICNATIPLADTAEARYGEIARKMLETGDWITPQHDYGVPFWAKPPLSTWLSAFSMKLFGVNEFAARLPSTLFGIAMLILVWHWCAPRRGRDFALAACAVLAGMSLFFMASGAVMTDSSLAFCATLTMVSFWQALHPQQQIHAQQPPQLQQQSPLRQARIEQKIWGYLFFVGLGLGLLAKGPLVGVLTFMPILPWMLFHKDQQGRKNWLHVWRALPWLSGSALMLIIALPWYLIAEHKTPGFLAYFILGEHFDRFLIAGWSGDKYGNAHVEPPGMIWAYWLISTLPWSFVLIAKLATKRNELLHGGREWIAASDGWLSYLLLWSFTSIVFFTVAHNVIWTYPLPTLPALAVLTVELLARSNSTKPLHVSAQPLGTRLVALNFFTPVVLSIVAALYTSGHDERLKSSQKNSAEYYLQVRPNAESGLYYFRRRYYSSEFYSAGKAKMIMADQISALFDNSRTDFLVIYPNDLTRLAPALRAHFMPLRTIGEFVMLREIDPHRDSLQPSP